MDFDESVSRRVTTPTETGPVLVLGPLLRWVDDESATIWVETSAACNVEVLDASARTFSIAGRFYALVVVSGLEPATTTPYDVRLDGQVVWPAPESRAPASVIRTTGGDQPVRILIGSCRAAAPHEAPYTQDLAFNEEGRGVDTLWAHARRMMSADPDSWPSIAVFAGDQIYADDSSPKARERIEATRSDSLDLSVSKVYGFEEYCWLYHEAWSSSSERWLLSTVPTAMIFDDHDMVDDWNISAAWIDEMSAEPTWTERAVNGYMSYWVYQHLGNLSPQEIATDGLLDELVNVADGTDTLRAWARQCVETAGSPGGHQFSHSRRVGDVTIITIDCRNGRVLEEGERLMVQQSEWDRIVSAAHDATGHVMFVTSVPVFLPNGIHDLHTWSARVCEGAWGSWGRRLGERVRRSLDLEDWPAFPRSFAALGELIATLKSRSDPAKSIVVASGDIHFSYAARIPGSSDLPGPDVWQIVSSPIRNALIPHERGAMRFATKRAGAIVGAVLRRASRGPDTRPHLQIEAGPHFANNMCEVVYAADQITVTFEHSTSIADGEDPDLAVVDSLTL